MEIIKFKKVGRNKYKVTLDDTELLIYEDIIFKYDLLIKKNIDIRTLDKLIDENRYYEAYYLALKYIEIKMRSEKEIINYLRKKDIDNNYIDFAVRKLNELGLLNNNQYIEAYINDKINLTSDGPFKIKRNLLELDFDELKIDSYLNKIDESVWRNKLKKIVNKKVSLMKNKSYFMIINKLNEDLFYLGYDKYMIDEELSYVKCDNSNIKKEFNKIHKKYNGEKNKIINALLRKGYTYEEINNCVNE